MNSKWRAMAILLALACVPGIHGSAVAADAGGSFTPTDLNTLARVSEPQVSPNGRYAVYVQRDVDFDANRGRMDLWLVDLQANPVKARRLTQHSANDTNPRWSIDGTSIYSLGARRLDADLAAADAGRRSCADHRLPLDIGTFRFSPDGGRLAITMEVFRDCPDLKCTHERLEAAGANKSSAPPTTRCSCVTGYRRDHTRSNLFVAPVLADGRAGTPVNVSGTLDADVPSKPMGGDEEFTFAPDGKHVVFSARVAGREEAWSTNRSVRSPTDGGAPPKNLTADNPAWDAQPVFLKNGDLAWLAMRRPGSSGSLRDQTAHDGAVRDVAAQWIGHLASQRDARWPHVARHCRRPRPVSAVRHRTGERSRVAPVG